MAERLNVALISGGMYDSLNREIAKFEAVTGVAVEIGFDGSHPALNAHLTSSARFTYDLVSTHTKYAPSQLDFLAPLNSLSEEFDADAFYPRALELARIDGRLYGVPRNIDVKLLHYRTDRIQDAPVSWEELARTAKRISDAGAVRGFVFTGCESGLFGMLYELAEMAGARLFPGSNIPELVNPGGAWALQFIRDLYRDGVVPPAVEHWHYDEAHAFFLKGGAAMICDWPGYHEIYRQDASIRLARMPAGPGGTHKAYAGSHTFALTSRGASKQAAVDLLRFLTSPQQQLAEAHRGSAPVRPAVLGEVLSEAPSLEAERWKLLETVIANDALIPPRLKYYPEIEEILWRTVRSAMKGEIEITPALESMERRITEVHRGHAVPV